MTAFLKHDGQYNAQFDGGRFARALKSNTRVFCVIRETPAFFIVESNDETPDEAGTIPARTLQVSKKTLKLAGRDAPRGGKFTPMEF